MRKASFGPVCGLGLLIVGSSHAPVSANSASPPAAGAPVVVDLVGARGSSGEMALQSRGYSLARTKGLTAYWRHPAGACVRVRTSQGRYKEIGPVVLTDCSSAAPAGAGRRRAPMVDRGASSRDQQACLQEITRVTQNPDVVLSPEAETAKAEETVYVGVGAARAKWLCRVKNGQVGKVMSMTDEGRF